MYSKELEELIEAIVDSGELTDAKRKVLHKRANAEGVDVDELDIILEGRLAKSLRQDKAASAADTRANARYGERIKCPSCGALVVDGKAVCPDCGYTFSNIKGNSHAKLLQEKIDEYNREHNLHSENESNAAKTAATGCLALYLWPIFLFKWFFKRANPIHKRKMDIISSFPVPNTRGDLLEFLTSIQMKINSLGSKQGCSIFSDNEDMSYAYWQLYANCINKSKMSFRNDPDFAPYFETYEQELKKTKGLMGFLKSNPKLSTALGIVIGYILLYALSLLALKHY